MNVLEMKQSVLQIIIVVLQAYISYKIVFKKFRKNNKVFHASSMAT